MTRARNIANRALSDITSPNTDQDITITPNGTGNVLVETDTFTIRNTSDASPGPQFILDHTTAAPSTTDVNSIFSIRTNDTSGGVFTPMSFVYKTPNVTPGSTAGQYSILIKEDSDFGSGSAYATFDGAAEQITFSKPVVMEATTDLEAVNEKVAISTSTSSTVVVSTESYAVRFHTANQTANRTVNFTSVNSTLDIGQSVTCAVLLTQGSTAYYLNAYYVDSISVTPKWQGGTAPTAGNANGIDVYSFTIIKTADATFTVLASQTQFA
jgi:hypothetical protein